MIIELFNVSGAVEQHDCGKGYFNFFKREISKYKNNIYSAIYIYLYERICVKVEVLYFFKGNLIDMVIYIFFFFT